MFPLRCQGPQVGRWVESFPEQMALLVCYLCIGQLNVNSRLGFPVTSAREKQYPTPTHIAKRTAKRRCCVARSLGPIAGVANSST